MRIVVDNVVDIPYENFIFRSLARSTETGIHTYFVGVCTTNPNLVIEIKEIYSEDELKDLISTISAAYCNGAKRVNI